MRRPAGVLIAAVFLGLMALWKSAWYVGLAWQLYTVAVFVAFLVPHVWKRFAAYQQELMTRWTYPAGTASASLSMANPSFFMKQGMFLGAIGGSLAQAGGLFAGGIACCNPECVPTTLSAKHDSRLRE